MEHRPKKLPDHVRDAIWFKPYRLHTEEPCVTSIKRYILFHNKRHSNDLGGAAIEAFLTHLAYELAPPLVLDVPQRRAQDVRRRWRRPSPSNSRWLHKLAADSQLHGGNAIDDFPELV
jgi:hypothetical protein